MILFSLKHFYSIKLLIYILSVRTALLFHHFSCTVSVSLDLLLFEQLEGVSAVNSSYHQMAMLNRIWHISSILKTTFFPPEKLQVIWQEN